MIPGVRKPQAVAAGGLLLALVLAGLTYAPGLGGDFHFDDQPNLEGLATVDDRESALDFITSGRSGPLGRPVALASFLVNAHSWPSDPAGFLYTNVLIHLFNALLLAWLVVRLGEVRREPPARAACIAAMAAALWAALPILASSSLLIVQRMTLLSATLVLAGLVAYLWFRGRVESRPTPSLAGMGVSLVLFTTLGAFTKENAVLLPVLALVMEATLLQAPSGVSVHGWRWWRAIFLGLPLAAIAAALAWQLPYSDTTVALRGFTAWERLVTESVILWEYLFNAFLPVDLGQLGPFQDDYVPYRSPLELPVLASLAGWLLAAGVAWMYRRRAPLLAFAVFWYLAGHLVESTVAPLELYFEHRNYVPLMGPCLALAWLAMHATRRMRRFAIAAFSAYVALMLVTVWQVAWLWGHPFESAKARYLENPGSARATGYLFSHIYALGAVEPAYRLLDLALEEGVAVHRYRVTQLYLACRHQDAELPIPGVRELIAELPQAPLDKHLARSIHVLAGAAVAEPCPWVGGTELSDMIDALLSNPAYRAHDDSAHWLYRARAELAQGGGSREKVKRALRSALTHRFDAGVTRKLLDLYLGDSETGKACRLLARLEADAPFSPVQRIHRHRKLADIRSNLRQSGTTGARKPPCGDDGGRNATNQGFSSQVPSSTGSLVPSQCCSLPMQPSERVTREEGLPPQLADRLTSWTSVSS